MQSVSWTVLYLMVWWPTSEKTVTWDVEGSGHGLTWSMMLSFIWNGWWKTIKIVSQASYSEGQDLNPESLKYSTKMLLIW